MTHGYDGHERRVSPQVDTARTNYWYDVGGTSLEISSTGAPTSTYLRDPGGRPLSISINGTHFMNYGTDRLGSVTANTDGAGNLANSYAWDAWGESAGVSGATYQPLMYAGTYQDHETGIYQMGARWYGAAQGRFTQMDPLPSSVMEANRYEYANSSPCNFTDPTGLMPQPCFEAGLGVATALLNYLPLGFLYEGAVKQGLLWAFERMWWVDAGHEAAEESDPTDLFFQAASVKIGWIPGIGQHLAAVMDILGTIPDWVKCHKILTSS